MNTTRENLVNSMKSLLWERGYDATSPNLVLEHSQIGKGSLYHHFRNKKSLAIAAMEVRTDELIEEFDQIFNSSLPWIVKLEQFFSIRRDADKGCKIGRIVQDPSMDKDLLEPAKRYFLHIANGIENTLKQAQAKGELSQLSDLQSIAIAIVSLVQGGFIISKSLEEKRAMAAATKGLVDLLRIAK